MKRHLNPGGMFTLYVPLYESDVRTVKSELATFFEAFPYSTIWANTVDGQGYDMVFMGHLDQPKIDIDAAEARLQRPEFAPVVESLREIGLPTVMDLFSTYTGPDARTSGRGWRARRSIAIAICACNISAAGASTRTSRTRSIARC